VWTATAGVTLGAMTLLWLASLARRDASIVDVWWGLGFVVIATVAHRYGPGAARADLVLAMVALWGLRLAGYLLWRNWGAEEDRRYQAMRRAWGERFWWVSYATVFLLQGALMWIVSLPAQHALASTQPLGALDVLGVGVFAVGLGFESIGDAQLARWKADPANAGRVMDRGLWRYTRHPNYFGDFLVWWGVWLVAAAAPGGLWTAVGPAIMSLLLMRVSGVPLLERSLARRRPGYDAYRRRTSAFFPWPPGSEGAAT
jgi:steroid 5-alpha reductase family enzyme